MNYRLTQFWYYVRKVLRLETRKGNLKKIVIAFLLGNLLSFIYVQIPFFRNLDEILLQKTFYYLRGPRPAPENIVLISIDDQSFKELNLSTRKPLPRKIFAEALSKIQEDRPKVVILDLHAPHESDEEVSTKALADAIAMGPTTIQKPIIGDNDTYQSDPIIRNAAAIEIFMRVRLEDDIVSFISSYPGLSQDKKIKFPLVEPIEKFVTKIENLPKDYDLINFYGAAGSIRNFSLWEFFSERGRIPKGFFKDKIVFVGFKSDLRGKGTSDKEVFYVPLPESQGHGSMYGVEIHASIAANLMDGSWLKRKPSIDVVVHGLLWSLIILGILIFEPAIGLSLFLFYQIVWFSISYLCFTKLNIFISGFYFFLFSSQFILGISAYLVANTTLKELRETKKMLGLGDN